MLLRFLLRFRFVSRVPPLVTHRQSRMRTVPPLECTLKLTLGDGAAECHGTDVQVLRPLLLDVRGGERGGAQRLLRLVRGPPPRNGQHKRRLAGGSFRTSTQTEIGA